MKLGLLHVFAFVFSCAVAGESKAQMIVGGKGQLVGSELITVDAQIDAIDLEAQQVTVTDINGNVAVVQIGPEIPVAQIKLKDKVKVSYREEIVLVIRKADGPPKTAEQRFAETAEGGMGLDAPTEAEQIAITPTPSGARGYETREYSVTIKDVNRAKGIVTVAGEGDSLRRISVGPEIDLEGVEPGDRIVMLVTDAVAVSITPR